MMHLRGLILFLWFLLRVARRSIRIDDSHHDAQQQNNTRANGFEVSAEAWQAFIPRGFGTGAFRRATPHTGAASEGPEQDGRRAGHLEPRHAAPWFRFGPRRAEVTLQAVSGPKGNQLPPKEDEQSSEQANTALGSVPKMIVFDLDNTLWTPELYQLRKLKRQNVFPKAGLDVLLFPGAISVLESIRVNEGGRWSGVKFAVASRTQSVEWAHHLLMEFGIRDLFDYVEIYPGNKDRHFANLRSKSGISYGDMLFLDDSRDGRYGNCVPVSRLGVLSAHCPEGLRDEGVFETAMRRYAEWSGRPGTVVEWDGTMTELPEAEEDGAGTGGKERVKGTVKSFFGDRGFGFIRYGGRGSRDLFFHERDVNGADVKVGDEVSFLVRNDKKAGKKKATEVSANKVDEGSRGTSDQGAVNMRVFSMNMPFAALLANGCKILETRNGTMFMPYPEGTKFLLHVGRRTYPDGNKHIDVMKSGGLDDVVIEKLKSLPNGFGRGMAVAILEIGRTFETTVEERSDPEFQRKVCAFGEDSGRMVTEIRRVEYLKRPLRVSGRGGVFKADIPRDALPDGWVSDGSGSPVVYSITGQ